MLCPLQAKCIAFASGRVDALPVKEGVTKTRDRFFNYLHIRSGQGLYMRQRTGKDIWQGLWEPPLIESPKPLTPKAMLAQLVEAHGTGWTVRSNSAEVKHVLSHQVIRAVFWDVVPGKGLNMPEDWVLVRVDDLEKHAVPRLIERWMDTTPA
jgi:A/G-specific adenine glycosylase